MKRASAFIVDLSPDATAAVLRPFPPPSLALSPEHPCRPSAEGGHTTAAVLVSTTRGVPSSIIHRSVGGGPTSDTSAATLPPAHDWMDRIATARARNAAIERQRRCKEANALCERRAKVLEEERRGKTAALQARIESTLQAAATRRQGLIAMKTSQVCCSKSAAAKAGMTMRGSSSSSDLLSNNSFATASAAAAGVDGSVSEAEFKILQQQRAVRCAALVKEHVAVLHPLLAHRRELQSRLEARRRLPQEATVEWFDAYGNFAMKELENLLANDPVATTCAACSELAAAAAETASATKPGSGRSKGSPASRRVVSRCPVDGSRHLPSFVRAVLSLFSSLAKEIDDGCSSAVAAAAAATTQSHPDPSFSAESRNAGRMFIAAFHDAAIAAFLHPFGVAASKEPVQGRRAAAHDLLSAFEVLLEGAVGIEASEGTPAASTAWEGFVESFCRVRTCWAGYIVAGVSARHGDLTAQREELAAAYLQLVEARAAIEGSIIASSAPPIGVRVVVVRKSSSSDSLSSPIEANPAKRTSKLSSHRRVDAAAKRSELLSAVDTEVQRVRALYLQCGGTLLELANVAAMHRLKAADLMSRCEEVA